MPARKAASKKRKKAPASRKKAAAKKVSRKKASKKKVARKKAAKKKVARKKAESRAKRGLEANCLFPPTIVLLAELHYTSPVLWAPLA